MIQKVLKMGNQSLLQKSEPILENEFDTAELHKLIEDLRDTMHATDGVGIAAPQIGVNKRIFVIEYGDDSERYVNIGVQPFTVIINPVLKQIDTELSSYNEGCLSVPGLRGSVMRSKHIEYSYHDQFGNLHTGQNDSFFARVLQHETDHLDGILYPMRMQDMSTLAFVDQE